MFTKSKWKQIEKPKMKIEFFLKIQKQEDTQYYTRRQDEYMNIPFEPLRRWSKIKTKNVYKIKMKTNWKTKNKDRICVKIQKQEDTQYYTRRRYEYMNIPFEPLRRWSKDPIKIYWKFKNKKIHNIIREDDKTRIWIYPINSLQRWTKNVYKIKMKLKIEFL